MSQIPLNLIIDAYVEKIDQIADIMPINFIWQTIITFIFFCPTTTKLTLDNNKKLQLKVKKSLPKLWQQIFSHGLSGHGLYYRQQSLCF